jgi:hypothetical protein
VPLGVFVPARWTDLAVDVHADTGTVAQGGVPYKGADGKWHGKAPGTSGQVWTSGGAGADPSWQTSASGVTDHGLLTGLSDDDHSIYALLAGRAGGQTLIGDTASGGSLTLVSTAHATKGNIILTGVPSSPGTGTNSEKFGLGSAAAGNDAAAFGNVASASGVGAVAVGRSTIASNTNTLAFGMGAAASGSGAVAIGASTVSNQTNTLAVCTGAQATGASSLAFGPSAVASGGSDLAIASSASASGGLGVTIGVSASTAGGSSVAIGRTASAGHSGSVAIGRDSATTATKQFVCGAGGGWDKDNVYFGSGVVNASPTAYTINGSGGSGTNIAGANLNLAGGKGTGSAIGGSVKLQSTIAGSSGTTLNSLQDKWVMTNDGIWQGWQRSTTADRQAFDITPTFATATDASRKARAVFNIWDTAVREGMRLEADGTNPMVGFLGASAVTRRTLGAASTDLPTVIILANNLRQAMIDLGLGQN